MGIVERVAKMLGPAAQSAPAPERARAAEGPDTIERALAAGLAGAAPRQGAAARVSTAAAGEEPRLLRIDRERLRAGNFVAPDSGRTPVAECTRRIKRALLGNVDSPVAGPAGGAPRNLVMVTSALPGEGKTFCAINLAISIAMELERTVLLVDADVAKPGVLAALGIENNHLGLLDVLAGKVALPEVLCRTDIETLTVLPPGTPSRRATEILASDSMRALVREMSDRYPDRIIIFDSPPLLVCSEASVLGGHMGQILLVVAACETTEAAVNEAVSRVRSCDIVGLVLNKAEGLVSGYGYGYGYGYGSEP